MFFIFSTNLLFRGYQTTIARELFSITRAWLLFGVSMGYYYAIAKFNKKQRLLLLLVPWLFHGIYEFYFDFKYFIFNDIFVPLFYICGYKV